MSESDAKTESKLFSLQEIAFDTAVCNLGRYKELIKSKISPPFRRELYKEAMGGIRNKTYKERYDLWKSLPYLEPHKTAEIFRSRELYWISPKCETKPRNWNNSDDEDDSDTDGDYEVTLDEVLRYLEQYAKNLKEIFIEYPRPFINYQKISKNRQLGPSSIDLICRMENLTTISISEFTINFTGFVRICREFDYLQKIEAEKILLDVPKCNMKTILETFNNAFDHQEYNECTFPTIFEITFKKTDSVENYRIARINLDDSIFVDSLPEITHLATGCGYECEDYQRHMMNFLRILSNVGGSLKKLTLIDFEQIAELTFKDIFEHCKSLESLDLRGSYIADANKPMNSFGKLKEFDWSNGDNHHKLALNSILCAPLLEKIHLISFEFDLGDKEALFNQIRKGDICTNVKKFTVLDLEFDDEPGWDEISELFHVIKMNSPEPVDAVLETCSFRPHCMSWW